MEQVRRIPTPERRAEDLARFLTKRMRYMGWCNSVNTDTLDIAYLSTDPVAQAAGLGDYKRGCANIRLDPMSDLVLELGLLPYSSRADEPVAWEAEVKALNAAHKKVIDARRANYRKVRPPRRRTRPYFPREVRKM